MGAKDREPALISGSTGEGIQGVVIPNMKPPKAKMDLFNVFNVHSRLFRMCYSANIF